MNLIEKKAQKTAIVQFFLISLLVTLVVWGVFAAQYLFSDVVTFAKTGDAARQTYPAFIQLGWQMQNHIHDGIDIFITNGSNSIHSDSLEWYFVYRFFAWLGAELNAPKALFIAFYALHMFLCMFFAQCLCFRCFGMEKSVAMLVAVSVASAGLFNSWFTGFYVIYNLVLPLCYFAIRAVKGKNTMLLLFSSLAYFVAFNSGYSLVSCCLAAAVFLFAAAFCALEVWEDSHDKRRVWMTLIRVIIPAAIGAVASFPRLLSMLLSGTSSSSTQSMTSLNGALGFSIEMNSIPYLFFFSAGFCPPEGGFLTIGLVWLFILIAVLVTHSARNMRRRDARLFAYVLVLTGLILVASMGDLFPLGLWFYEIPFLGAMHLRQRFLLILYPLFFLVMGLGLEHLSFRGKKEIVIACVCMLTFMTAVILVFRDSGMFQKKYLLFESIISVIVIVIMLTENVTARKAIVLAGLYILCFHCNRFYSNQGGQEVTATSGTFTSRSIAFNENARNRLDQFVSELAPKELYKYVGMDKDDDVPMFIMNNYGWYHKQNYDLCNYLKYALHGSAISDAYRSAAGTQWFNIFKWDYLFDTRGDFVVLMQERIDRNPELYSHVIDYDSGNTFVDLGSGYLAASMRKYIPRHYTNGERVEDAALDTLDNGYFYSPVVAKDDVFDFNTDKASYFSIDFYAGTDGDVQFSMAPVPQYRYYLDGEEIEPTVDYYLCYFPVTAGEHTIEIRYFNRTTEMIAASYKVFHLLVLACLAFLPFEAYYLRGGRNKRNGADSAGMQVLKRLIGHWKTEPEEQNEAGGTGT